MAFFGALLAGNGLRTMFTKVFATNILIVIIIGLATAVMMEAAVKLSIDADSLSADASALTDSR